MSAAANINPVRVAELAAELGRMAAIDDLEVFASTVLEVLGIEPDEDEPEYHVLSRSRGDDMLSWSVKRHTPKGAPTQFDLRVQIQDIGGGFARIGAIGDGNCMVHSLFTAASPTYRRQDMETRQKIADKFRDILAIRVGELRYIADDVYSEIGGAVAIEDSFENLEGVAEGNGGGSADVIRTEIDIELGPVIAKLYNFNFLAVRLDARLNMLPVKQSLYGRDPDMPTIFIHYSGGATDFGAANAFGGQGHYEVIVRPVLADGHASSSRRTTARKTDSILPASGTVVLNEDRSTFMFSDEDLAGVLTKFGDLNAANMNSDVAAAVIAAAERKRAEGRELSPATLRTLAALERKAAAANSDPKPTLFSSPAAAARVSSNRSISPRTKALIAALEAKSSSSKKSSSPKAARRVTRKATSAAGGAGAPPTRRSERLRKTTQKKKSSSSNRELSPNTIAAMIESMKIQDNHNA